MSASSTAHSTTAQSALERERKRSNFLHLGSRHQGIKSTDDGSTPSTSSYASYLGKIGYGTPPVPAPPFVAARTGGIESSGREGGGSSSSTDRRMTSRESPILSRASTPPTTQASWIRPSGADSQLVPALQPRNEAPRRSSGSSTTMIPRTSPHSTQWQGSKFTHSGIFLEAVECSYCHRVCSFQKSIQRNVRDMMWPTMVGSQHQTKRNVRHWNLVHPGYDRPASAHRLSKRRLEIGLRPGLRPILEDPREHGETLCFECAERYRAAVVVCRWYAGVLERKQAVLTIQRYGRGFLVRKKMKWVVKINEAEGRWAGASYRQGIKGRLLRCWRVLYVCGSFDIRFRENRQAAIFVFCFIVSRCSFGILMVPKAFELLGNSLLGVLALVLIGTSLEDRLFRALYKHTSSHGINSIADALARATGGQRWQQFVLKLTYCTNCMVITCAMYTSLCFCLAGGWETGHQIMGPPSDSLLWLLGFLIYCPFLIFGGREVLTIGTLEKASTGCVMLAFVLLTFYLFIVPRDGFKDVNIYAPAPWDVCAWGKSAALLFAVFLKDTIEAPFTAAQLSKPTSSYGRTLSLAVWSSSALNFILGLLLAFSKVTKSTVLYVAQILWICGLLLSLCINLSRAQHHLHAILSQLYGWVQHSIQARRGHGPLARDQFEALSAPGTHDLASWRVLWSLVKKSSAQSSNAHSERSSVSSFNIVQYTPLVSSQPQPFIERRNTQPLLRKISSMLSSPFRTVSRGSGISLTPRQTPRSPVSNSELLSSPLLGSSYHMDTNHRAPSILFQHTSLRERMRVLTKDGLSFILCGVVVLVASALACYISFSISLNYAARFWTASFGFILTWHTAFHVYVVLGIAHSVSWDRTRMTAQDTILRIEDSVFTAKKGLKAIDFALVAVLFLLTLGGILCDTRVVSRLCIFGVNCQGETFPA